MLLGGKEQLHERKITQLMNYEIINGCLDTSASSRYLLDYPVRISLYSADRDTCATKSNATSDKSPALGPWSSHESRAHTDRVPAPPVLLLEVNQAMMIIPLGFRNDT